LVLEGSILASGAVSRTEDESGSVEMVMGGTGFNADGVGFFAPGMGSKAKMSSSDHDLITAFAHSDRAKIQLPLLPA
jgi:hypothetical protein